MKKYIDYINNFQCNKLEEVEFWINSNLSNHLKSNPENQDDIEHILDYLCSNDSPKRLKKMSYDEALKGSEKWMNKLIKNNKNIVETDSDVENASSGDNSKNASSGNYSKNASSGNYSQNASSGNHSKNASSGNHSKNASSGNYSQNASSGDRTTWEISGKNNVVASIGYRDKVKAVIGTWVTLAEYEENEGDIWFVKTVVSKQIDGKILKENVYYSLINGEFTEVE
jgi:hypothetical protein